MNQEIEKLIQDQFQSLPESIQKVITESRWENKVRNLAKRYHLHIDQETDIENQTLLTMLGFEVPEDFVKNLIENANLHDDEAEVIAKEIDRDVFQMIREQLINAPKSQPTEQSHTNQNIESDRPSSQTPSQNPQDVQTQTHLEQQYEDQEMSRDSLLNEIENPSPTPITTRRTFDHVINADPTSVPEPEIVVPDSAIQKSKSSIPENLPVGNIEDVPPHGHNHNQPEARAVSQAASQPNEQQFTRPVALTHREEDIMNEKFNSTTISPTENFTETEDRPEVNKPPAQKPIPDPYREPIE